jgi:hypothetical protein
MSKRSKPVVDRDDAVWAAWLERAGFARVGERAVYSHPAGGPALQQHRGRDGRSWFTAARVDAPQFDAALWRRFEPAKRGERAADRIKVLPQAGCELAALRFLAGTQTDDDVSLWLSRRNDLDSARREALLAARVGQGEFRHAVEAQERACRVTGLLDRRHLRAVHIRPWRCSDDAGKLDGHNGLLLSPHVAQLFESGALGFELDGQLRWSRHLNPAVLKSWRLPASVKPVEFSAGQRHYLDWHRRHVFEAERRPWARRTGG